MILLQQLMKQFFLAEVPLIKTLTVLQMYLCLPCTLHSALTSL